MASITKNPLVLQAANRINSWFISQVKDNKSLKLFNSLEMLESDEHTLEFMKDLKRSEQYEDLDHRIEKVKKNE